ncbi:MAG: ATP-binding protein [Microcoleaceae cyanobacterium]
MKYVNLITEKIWSKLPLRTALVLPFLIQIVGAVGLVGYLSYRSGQSVVNQLVIRLSQEASEQIENHIYSQLDRPITVLDVILSSIANNELDPTDFTQLRCSFYEKVRQPELVNHLGFGDVNGDTVSVEWGEREDESRILVAKIRDQFTRPERVSYELGPDCKLATQLERSPYDARIRPWYQAAVLAGERTWSPIYYLPGENEIEFSASAPVYDPDNRLIGVLHSEVTLDAITEFLSELEISTSGQAMIISSSGALVASTSEEPTVQAEGLLQRPNIVDSKMPIVRSTAQHLLKEFGRFSQIRQQEQFIFKLNGQREIVHVTPLKEQYGLNWLIIVVIPESDFMGEINLNLRRSALLCLATLFSAILAGLLTTRWVIRPIETLNRAAKAVATGKFGYRVEIDRADELGKLGESFNSMAQQLQTSFINLKSVNENLEAQSRLAEVESEVGLSLTRGQNLDEILQHHTESMVIYLNAYCAEIWLLNSNNNCLELRSISGMQPQQQEESCYLPAYYSGISSIFTTQETYITNDLVNDQRINCCGWATQHNVAAFAGYPLTLENQQIGLMTLFTQEPLSEARVKGLELLANTVALAINHKVSEQLLAEYRKNLEQKVEERTAELMVAKEKAEVANQAKSTFIANMSHELRSPLNAILGFAQIMMRSPLLAGEDQENITIIARSGEHLLNLINQVLDLSKIEAGQVALTPQKIDLYQLIGDLEDLFIFKADEKGLELRFEIHSDTPQYIKIDALKLRQILINLLSNALKFTTEGSVIVRVQGQLLDPEKVELLFEVEDTGLGIAPEELHTLFDAFVQTQVGRDAQEGTGLGLSISQEFIQLMGGEITVRSQLGQGTSFKFNLPAEIVEEVTVENVQSKRRVIALQSHDFSHRILIVDDKPLNRQLLVKLLVPIGFELQEAANGQEAIDIWQQWEPHLVWMDVRMPVMDGYQATREIKATPKGQATPIIALTASIFEEERALVLSAGCNDFMRKPFREAEIFDMISKHLGVQYIYEDLTEDSIKNLTENKQSKTVNRFSKTLLKAQLKQLPLEWQEDLEQAICKADTELMDQALQQIKTRDLALASALKADLDNFEYNRILELIRESKQQEL